MVIAAFTPHLYYNILKSNVPDLFDITKGRVYREIIIDERFPYWLYEAIISNRLAAYSTRSFNDLKTAAGGRRFMASHQGGPLLPLPSSGQRGGGAR